MSQSRSGRLPNASSSVPDRPTLEGFTRLAMSYRDVIGEQETVVECITAIHEQALISGNNHVYNDPYFIVQLAGGMRGSCFGFPAESRLDLREFIGTSAFAALEGAPDFLIVCLLDAIFLEINRLEGIAPVRSVPYEGTAAQNGRLQAKVLAELAHVEPGTSVALIGVVEDIVQELLDRGAEPRLADLHLAGESVCGLNVGNDAESLITRADAVIMTGNTLKTRTIDTLLAQAVSCRARTVVFAMSGANIASRYRAFGANAVTTEQYPYFWYPGLGSTINIFESA
jgi:Putative heavy-metal chelation